jgi:long-chain acyl-CoA synthetase
LAISGGASLNDKIARFFLKIGILVLEGYGLTETSPVVAVNREKDFKFGTVGKPISGVKIKISSEKEILVKGPNVTPGYFKNPEATKAVFDSEAWFCTGDMGFLSQEGFLTIIGRKKEMIVTSGGKNVWPEPIENLLNKDRFIANSMVVGHKRKFISALIVPDWEEVDIFLKEKNLVAQEPEKLIRHPEVLRVFQERIDQKINPSLSDFEKIKKFKLIAHDFSQEREELTPTLKLRRHIAEQHYQREIEEMYS